MLGSPPMSEALTSGYEEKRYECHSVSARHGRNKTPWEKLFKRFKTTVWCGDVKIRFSGFWIEFTPCKCNIYRLLLERCLSFCVRLLMWVFHCVFQHKGLRGWSQMLNLTCPSSMGRCECSEKEVQIVLIYMPNTTESELAPGPLHWRVVDFRLSEKPLPHAGWVSAPRPRPSTPRHMCVELSRCYHALARLCAPPPLSLPGLLSD